MSQYVAEETLKLAKKQKLNFNLRIAILGFAFKENIPDIRNTKIFEMTDYFRKKM